MVDAAHAGAAIAFAGLDTRWLGATNAALYRPVLHGVLIDGFRPVPAVLFYLVGLLGVSVFVIASGLAAGKWSVAMRRGAMFGFFACATYDLPNQETPVVWSTRITALDLMWGTIVTAAGGDGRILGGAGGG